MAECAIDGQNFAVTEASNPLHVQVRSRSALFLKDNLPNLAYNALPETAKYVAWIDDDITFCQDNLAKEVVEALQKNPVIQLFERAEDLGPEGEIMYTHKSAAAYKDGERLFTGEKFYTPPHARR